MSAIYWNNTRIFEAFSKLEKNVDGWLAKKQYHFFHFSDKLVSERQAQRLVELCFPAFAKSCASRYAKSGYPLSDVQKLEMGGVIVDQHTGEVKISVKLFLNCIVKFIFLWVRLSKYILSSIRMQKNANKKKISLLFGVSGESLFQHGSDARFIDYVHSGPVEPLQASAFTIVYYPKHIQSTSSENVVYHPLPVEAIVEYAKLGLSESLSLLFTHIASLILFLYSVIRQPLSVLLFSDAAYSRCIQKLDSLDVIDHVIITNANFQQYTWMRDPNKHFSVHQVYYSQNIKPLVYKQDPVSADYPAYKHTTVDEIWVWNQDICTYLGELGILSHIHIAGPVVWQLPPTQTVEYTKNYDIIIFDITPVTPKAAIDLGVINNYYSTGNMISFLSDIIQTCKEINERYHINTRLFLKNKRTPSAINDTEYADFISGLLHSGQLSGLVNYSADIFSLLLQNRLSITIPFSSTSTIADSINRPAIIYDFSESLINNYADSENLYFVSGKKDLSHKIIQIFEFDQQSIN